MSALVQNRPDVAETRSEQGPRHRVPVRETHPFTRVLLGVFCVALALRLYRISESYNTFIDEITYSQLGHNVANGQGLVLYGQPFNLHPPVVFGLLAGVIRSAGLGNTGTEQLVVDLRPVVAVFGALIVVATLIVARLCNARRAVAVAATAMVAIDPFQISFDSRVLLEAFAQFFVICAVIGLLVMVVRPARIVSRPARHRAALAATGVAVGLAFSTKETFGLVLGATFLLTLVLPRLLPRRQVLAVLGIGVCVYLAVISAVWLTSGFHPWWHAHASGFERLIGTEQNTGFNASSTKVSLSSRVAANLKDFAVTYLLLAAGGLTALTHVTRSRPWRSDLLTSEDRARTVISVWTVAACGYLAYATLFGSIEEQMYYIPLVPCILSLTLAAGSLRRRSVTRVLAVGVVLALAFQSFVWVSTRRTDNNLYAKFFAWEQSNVLAGARIGVAEDVAQFVLKDVAVGKWTTPAALAKHSADYVLVDRQLVEQGYSTMTPSTLTYLLGHSRVAFRAKSGDDVLYFFNLRRQP